MTEKKHNYFYKITNKINGKFYYGIHSTNNLDDGYMGSGVVLRRSIAKYGKVNFTKEIIADYLTRKEASEHEKMVVTLELVEYTICLNLRTGGDDGYTYHSMHNIGPRNPMFGVKHTDATKKKISAKATGRTVSENTRLKLQLNGIGKTLTEASRNKISENLSGDKHPHFGIQRTETEKEKNRRGNIGKRITEEHKQINRLALTGKKRSDEFKQKIKDSWVLRKQPDYIPKNKSKSSKKIEVFRYEVDGIMFHNAVELAKHHNISRDSARFRCYSDKEFWKNWKVIYVEIDCCR